MIPRSLSLSKLVPGGKQLFLKKFIQVLKQEMIPLEIVDPNGQTWTTAPNGSTASNGIRHRLMIKDQRFFNALISPNAFSLGQAYINGYFDVTGNIRELYEMICDKLLSTNQPKRLSSFLGRMVAKAREREKKNIEYHYDVPSEFYRIFLGETMGYTCGYYVDSNATMSHAQNEKMDIVCRKLRLQEGDHLLDIGCGWGNFAVYAARHYHVRVTGITLSQEQKDYADEWIIREGLGDQVTTRILNYRDLGQEQFDKISCVGMSEHVGQANMKGFFEIVYKCLKPDGLFLQHTITTNTRRKKGYSNQFLDTYMFPGGELMREQELVDLGTTSGFELLNSENFRVHYVKTLADWIHEMEINREKLLSIVSENVYRIYHVFFIGSLISFQQKEISLFQNLFYKSRPDDLKPGDSKQDYFISPFSKNEKRLT